MRPHKHSPSAACRCLATVSPHNDSWAPVAFYPSMGREVTGRSSRHRCSPRAQVPLNMAGGYEQRDRRRPPSTDHETENHELHPRVLHKQLLDVRSSNIEIYSTLVP